MLRFSILSKNSKINGFKNYTKKLYISQNILSNIYRLFQLRIVIRIVYTINIRMNLYYIIH